MTVGDFRDATRRALTAAGRDGDHPLEDPRELADTRAAARLLFTGFADHLTYTAGAGARYQPWGTAVAAAADLLPRTPALIRDAHPARAYHPLARSYLATAGGLSLERELLAANPERISRDARLWLIRDTIDRTATAAAALQLFADSIRPMHAGTARQVFTFASDAAQAVRAVRDALPDPAPDAAAHLLTRSAGTRPHQLVSIADMPKWLRPALGRLLRQVRRFDPAAPPDRTTLRAYSVVVASGAATVAAILEQADPAAAAPAAEAWRAASRPWTRLHHELTHVATAGRRDPVTELAAADVVGKLDQLRRRPAPAPAALRSPLLGDAAALAAAMHELATHQRRLATRLEAGRGLYEPTRRLPALEAEQWERRLGPIRWLPMRPAVAADLVAFYTEGNARITAAAALAPRPPTGPTRQQDPIALTALEQLARSHARTAVATPRDAVPARPHLRP